MRQTRFGKLDQRFAVLAQQLRCSVPQRAEEEAFSAVPALETERCKQSIARARVPPKERASRDPCTRRGQRWRVPECRMATDHIDAKQPRSPRDAIERSLCMRTVRADQHVHDPDRPTA